MTQWCNRTDNVLKLEQRARVRLAEQQKRLYLYLEQRAWVRLAEQQKRLAKKTRHAMESLDSHLYHDVIAMSSTPTVTTMKWPETKDIAILTFIIYEYNLFENGF